ncbi:hypothetical protein SDC9_141652 [bioreactor metagenome]|uniref:Uncharacterized protein n=1 Tax=bioreactor metagenome TaxID=1076179 RepID=A0A645DYT5_9ZZZZ
MAGDKQLFDHRFVGKGNLSEATTVDRQITDMEEREILFIGFFLDYGEAVFHFLVFPRQEDESCAIPSFCRNRNSLQKNKLMRDLYQYPCPVSGDIVGAFGTPVYHVL